MIFSTREEIDRLAPRVPRSLITPPALARVRAAAAALPEVASSALFECRLGPGASRVDLMICVKADEGGRDALAALPEDAPLRRSPAWAPVFDLVSAWSEPSSLLDRAVPFVCLEFDVPGPPPEVPAPLVFFCAQPHLLSGPLRPGSERALGAALGRALEILRGRPLPAATAERLAACKGALPAGGHVLHAAPLDARGEDMIRLVCSMPRDALPGYLERIGWPGSMSELGEILPLLYAHTSQCGFHLDVGAEVSPMIGLESYYPHADPRHAQILDWLCARGACTEEKRAGVLGWPGREEVVLPRRRWPSTGYRTFQIKVVSRPGRPMEAKAYLGFGHHFSPVGAPS